VYGNHVIGCSVSLLSRSLPEGLVKHERFLAHCDNDFRLRKPINNPLACESPAIRSSGFPSIPRVGSVGGGTLRDP